MFIDAPKLLLATTASAVLLLAHPTIHAKKPPNPPGQMGNENSQKPDVPPGQKKKNNRNLVRLSYHTFSNASICWSSNARASHNKQNNWHKTI